MCIQLYMLIHFLVADVPVDAVETAERTQQGNKFIVNDRFITRYVKGI